MINSKLGMSDSGRRKSCGAPGVYTAASRWEYARYVNPANRFECVERQREPVPRIVLRWPDFGQPVTIDAARVIEQYAVTDTDTLIVLDEDVPFEEQLHLVLVREDKIIDHIEIGAPYSTGEFREIERGEGMLRFAFDGDDIWQLGVRSDGKRVFGGLPPAARRRGGFFAPRFMFLDREGDRK